MSVRTTRAQSRGFSTRAILLSLTGAAVLIGIVVAIAMANRVPQIDTTAPALSLLSAGAAAPPFSVASTQGPVSLDSTSKPIFLEVFATWCPHCQRETGVINRLYDRFGHQVQFVAVSGSPYGADRASPETLSDVLGFANYFHVRYPIAYDASLDVMKSYLQGGYPTVAIIGSDKKIAYIASGEISAPTLQAQITKVLKAK
jgi:cytochrome c biogenesis protein CcmG, thiol:disulfide interchange protein DsbE